MNWLISAKPTTNLRASAAVRRSKMEALWQNSSKDDTAFSMKTVHAIYEKWIFRPHEAVNLAEHTEVEFEPRPVLPPTDDNGNLDAIYALLSERYASGEHDVAARHNEHQP